VLGTSAVNMCRSSFPGIVSEVEAQLVLCGRILHVGNNYLKPAGDWTRRPSISILEVARINSDH